MSRQNTNFCTVPHTHSLKTGVENIPLLFNL